MLEQGDELRNRYKVIRRLGKGGMGAVYEAYDSVFEASVALKEISVDLRSAHDTRSMELAHLAFEREAKLLAKINHETIPHIKDYFAEDDSQFFVMELVDGDDLAKLLKQRSQPFPVGAVIEWTDQLLDALDYLHTQSPPIIHRDIKPQNLKLTTRKKIKLLDFGIAKGTDASSADTIAGQTFIAATLNYSPLEQMVRVLDPTFLAVITHKYAGRIEKFLDQSADVRSDLYSLGATVYHLATNKRPAEAVKRCVEIWDGIPDPLKDPAELNPQISREFAEFLIKAMRIDRDERFSSAAEMRAALRSITAAIARPSLEPTVAFKAEDFRSQETVVPETVIDESPEIGGPAEVVTEIPAVNTASGRAEPTVESLESASSASGAKKRSKLIWLIPAVALFLVMTVVGISGVFLVLSSLEQRMPDSGETGPASDSMRSDEPGDVDADPLGPTGSGVSLQSGVGTEDETPPENPEPTLPATPEPTPTPRPSVRPVAQPAPTRVVRQEPKQPVVTPRPKKNMDCIFTDDCR